jgi:hypothetical protein
MNLQAMFNRRLNKRIAKKHVIRVRQKNGLTVITALNDVLRLTGDNVARKARHRQRLSIKLAKRIIAEYRV